VSEPKLLQLLDAYVRSQPGPPGFSGSLSIGAIEVLEAGNRIRWWSAVFDATGAKTCFGDDPDLDASTLLLVPPSEAELLLDPARGRAKAVGLELSGDAALFRRFVERYVRDRSAVALRAGG
jgi:hypothetical protein